MSNNTNTQQPVPQTQVVVQKGSMKGCWIAVLILLGIGILCVGGCFLAGALGIGAIGAGIEAVSDSIEEAEAKKKEAIKDLEIVNFKWNKEGFGSVMEADITIKNNGTVDVKDIKIECVHYAPSGTKIDSNTRTFYEVIKAGESREFKGVNMGFIHSQAEKSESTITSATIVE